MNELLAFCLGGLTACLLIRILLGIAETIEARRERHDIQDHHAHKGDTK